MNDDASEPRTVFQPNPAATRPPASAGPPLAVEPEPVAAEPPPIVEQSGWDDIPPMHREEAADLAPSSEPADVTPAPAPPSAPPSPVTTAGFHAIAPGAYGRVEVGSVLNNIFQVTRFIARGGMGEVFEGINVNTDERVAIKVILPALAQDPTVQAMFRKEAKTLTRLQHPAVVQYRVLAQEPQLNVLYIVTEFIEGQALSDMLGKLQPSSGELRGLMRCLCEGLRAAHNLGAIHRDLSPDNVLLRDDRLDHAKIIDFGIAKDLDASTGTIVGDGFAGKLGYVAPEQFGDFGREIGPWTDIYSLGLVILAVASGRNVDMGATLVEAVDKRRAGPDLTPIPEDLRPVLEQMLQPDPARRLRSMDEVLRALDGGVQRTVIAPRPAAALTAPAAPASAAPAAPVKPKSRLPLLIGGGIGALVVIGGAAAALLTGHHAAPASSQAPVAGTAAASGPAGARQAVEAALPYLGCTWLKLGDATPGPNGLQLSLLGVAGSPSAAEAAVSKAAAGAGATIGGVDLDGVASVDPPVCAALDAFRLIRDPGQAGASRLSTAKTLYPMTPGAGGKPTARAEITLNIGQPDLNFALFGLEPSGKIDPILTSRAMAEKLVGGPSLQKVGPDSFLLPLDTDHTGWSGLLLLTGKGPFDPALVAAPPADRGAQWPQRFKAAADAGGWKADMVWYKTTA